MRPTKLTGGSEIPHPCLTGVGSVGTVLTMAAADQARGSQGVSALRPIWRTREKQERTSKWAGRTMVLTVSCVAVLVVHSGRAAANGGACTTTNPVDVQARGVTLGTFFSPTQLPPELVAYRTTHNPNAAAVTVYSLSDEPNLCHENGRVKTCSIVLTLSNIMMLPTGAPDALIAHEQGHATLNDRILARAVERRFKPLCRAVIGKRSSAGTTLFNATMEGHRKALQVQLDALGRAYDALTSHAAGGIGPEDAARRLVPRI